MFSLVGINWLKVQPDVMIPLNMAPDLPLESYNTVSKNTGQQAWAHIPGSTIQ